MTKQERARRIAELRERKNALTWKFIGACEEINAQIKTLEATVPEGVEDESGKKA